MTMIYTIGRLVPSASCSTPLESGEWVRAMHLPFYEGLIGRVGSAWAVLCGRAYAVRWPEAGEFERAIERASTT
jgi:hypothetical protein